MAGYINPRLSPDGRQIAVGIEGATTFDIWTYHLEQQRSTRLTFEGDNIRPVWSPDGKRIAFASVRDDALTSIYVKAADGSGKAELLYSSEHLPKSGGANPSGWSPDGTSLVVEFLIENSTTRMARFVDDA